MASREWDSLSDVERDTIVALQQTVPVKLSAIARALGVRVKASTLAPGISGELRPDPESAGQFLIRVNRHDASRRQRFTVAHELAHFLLHREQIGDGIADDVLYRSSLSDRREAEANRLASEILMPPNLIRERLSTAQSIGVEDVVSYMADQFEVSEAAMKIKLGMK